MAISHPSQAVKKMLDLKGADYERVDVLPLNQRVHLRLAGFRGGTVPALKLDGQRLQGSRAIARALDERWPDPPLFPRDAALRARVEEAERWGERDLQPVPRRLFRYGAGSDPQLRRDVLRRQGFPAPRLLATVALPTIRYYGRTVEADGLRANVQGVRADLRALPGMLDRVDRLLEEGTLSLDPPNAATLQIVVTVRVLETFEDLSAMVRAHACAEPARELFADYPAALPRFLPSEWLEPIRAAARA